MVNPSKIFGRLGNQLFQYAFLFAYSKDYDTDFYFQNPVFFENHEKNIKTLFGQDIKPVDMVAIHLRRGDYVNNKFYVDLSSTNYYQEAMKLFPREKFLVFSDDIEYAKTYFVGNEFEFSEGNNEIQDLNLMAGCKGIIIANSSFSYWGAYLGDSKKKVVAPKAWYTDGNQTRTVCPKHWIRL